MVRIGVDVGGTFTDFVFYQPDRDEMWTRKVPTSNDKYSGVLQGLEESKVSFADIEYIFHGTTVAINTLIEREGADCGLIATEGFRDLLAIRRGDRPSINLWWKPNDPLVPRRYRMEVEERLDYNGDVITALNPDQARDAVRYLRERDRNSIAVCFLNSYLNAAHEKEMAAIIREEYPSASISLSSQIVPEIQEYERTAAAVINAYVLPAMESYQTELSNRLEERGCRAELRIMTMEGGNLPSREVLERPLSTITAGPVAGVIASEHLARLGEYDNVITADMGGTSFEYGIISGGEMRRATEYEPEFGTVIPYPSIDVETIGAGGGTIARVNRGRIEVGPQSAGADPGPACYGLGGKEPTLTDAEVVLGKLTPRTFLGGEIEIDRSLAEDAIRETICAQLDMELVEAASAIERLLIARMTDRVRVSTRGRGMDPREFSFLVFGGAGPLLVPYIAREIGVPRVVVPREAGVFSALGLLVSDIRQEFVEPVMKVTEEVGPEEFERMKSNLLERCEGYLDELNVDPADRRTELLVNARYYGQSKYIEFPCGNRDHLIEAFLDKYEEEYFYTVDPDQNPVELVNLRGVARAPNPRKPELRGEVQSRRRATPAGTRDVWMRERGVVEETEIYDRGQLEAGHRIEGPAIVEQDQTTITIPQNMRGKIDAFQNLVIREATR